MNFLEVHFQKILEIKIYYFFPKTLESYKILKKNLIPLLFLFCPTSFHAVSEYIAICPTCYRILQKYFDAGNYIEENKLKI